MTKPSERTAYGVTQAELFRLNCAYLAIRNPQTGSQGRVPPASRSMGSGSMGAVGFGFSPQIVRRPQTLSKKIINFK